MSEHEQESTITGYFKARDLVVNLIAKAIDTGSTTRKPKDERFFVGRVTAFVYSAAMTLHMAYGVDFEEARASLLRQVNAARKEWPEEYLADAKLVGVRADAIVSWVLDA